MASEEGIPAGLEANKAVLSVEELAFATTMVGAGQAHLFEKWPGPGEMDEEKKGLIAQLVEADSKYGGGIVQYLANARKLLADSAAGADPFKGYTPSIPAGATVTAHTDEWESAEGAGLAAMGDCAFMLVAGGLGERLGYHGIKIALPTESCSERCYLSLYIETILSYQAAARKARGDDSIICPLAIMTSADTDERTRALLDANANFGMAEGQVVLLKQGKVPSIENNDGRIALDESGFQVQTKPHGHGDVHSLLHMSGTVKSWLAMGKKYMFIFQDTNAFALRSCLVGLGISVTNDFDMNSVW
jgi:UDP-sugar pyrophosphorylase